MRTMKLLLPAALLTAAVSVAFADTPFGAAPATPPADTTSSASAAPTTPAPSTGAPLSPADAAARATRQGKWTQALDLWQKVSDSHPEDPVSAAEIGWAEMKLGQTSDARRDFARALRLSPTQERAQTGLIQIAIHERRFDDAVQMAQQMIHTSPNSAVSYRNLGDAQLAASRRSDAEAAYRKAVALDPSDAKNHAGLGEAVLMRNKADEAVKEYRQAVRLDPSSAAYWEGLGRAASAGARYAEAAHAFAKAMDIVRQPVPDWTKLDSLTLDAIDALGRASNGAREGWETREDMFEANTDILAVTDALSDYPSIRDSDPTGTSAMAERSLAYNFLGQAAASELALIKKGTGGASADAVVYREQARRAIVSAQAASQATAQK